MHRRAGPAIRSACKQSLNGRTSNPPLLVFDFARANARNLEQLMRAQARGHAPTKARDMHGRLRNAYRTFDVRVEIDQTERASFNGSDRRYEVRWAVARPRYPDGVTETLGLFKEQLAFISLDEAMQHGKGRAHLWVDCVIKLQKGRAAAPTTGSPCVEETK